MAEKVYTGDALCLFCAKLLEEKAGYVWGGRGKVYDTTERDYLYKNFKTDKYDYTYFYVTQWKLWKDHVVVDCSGTLQAFRGIDDTADGLYNSCTSKGAIGTLPKNKRGVLLFVHSAKTGTKTHVGVYDGYGNSFESKNSATGFHNEELDTSRWTHWGIAPWCTPTIVSSTTASIGKVKITADILNVRRGPSTIYDKVGTVAENTVLDTYEERNGWYRISPDESKWISGSYTKGLKKYTVGAATLNVRSAANNTASIVGTLKRGAEVYAYEETTYWVKIAATNKWVYKSCLK